MDDSGSDSPSPPPPDPVQRPMAPIQWVGLFMLVVLLGLFVAQSLEFVYFEDSTLRLFLITGIILAAGREAILAVIDR